MTFFLNKNNLLKKTFTGTLIGQQRSFSISWQGFRNFSLKDDIRLRWTKTNRKLVVRHAIDTSNISSLYFLTVVLKKLKNMEESREEEIKKFEVSLKNKGWSYKVKSMNVDLNDFGITEEEFNAIDSKDPELNKIHLFFDTTDTKFFSNLYKARFGSERLEYPSSRFSFVRKRPLTLNWPVSYRFHPFHWLGDFGFCVTSLNILQKGKKSLEKNEKIFSWFWKDFLPDNKFKILNSYVDHWFSPGILNEYDDMFAELSWCEIYDGQWQPEEWRPEYGPKFTWEAFRFSSWLVPTYLFFFKNGVNFMIIIVVTYFGVFYNWSYWLDPILDFFFCNSWRKNS